MKTASQYTFLQTAINRLEIGQRKRVVLKINQHHPIPPAVPKHDEKISIRTKAVLDEVPLTTLVAKADLLPESVLANSCVIIHFPRTQ